MEGLYNQLPSSILDDFIKSAEREERLRIDLYDDFGEYDDNERKLAVACCFVGLMLEAILELTTMEKSLEQITKLHDLSDRLDGYSDMLDDNIISFTHKVDPFIYKDAINNLVCVEIPPICERLFLKYCKLMNMFKRV